jgi:hypothetical protein
VRLFSVREGASQLLSQHWHNSSLSHHNVCVVSIFPRLELGDIAVPVSFPVTLVRFTCVPTHSCGRGLPGLKCNLPCLLCKVGPSPYCKCIRRVFRYPLYFTSEFPELGSLDWFREVVRQHVVCWTMFDCNFSRLDAVLDEEVHYLTLMCLVLLLLDSLPFASCSMALVLS